MNKDITNLDVPKLTFISTPECPKVRAIRELADGTVIDVREIESIDKMCHTSFNINFKSGAFHTIRIDSEKYRQLLIRYWRYFNGV